MKDSIKYHHLNNNSIIAEITDKHYFINDPQDILDLMADVGMNNCNRIIIHECNLNKDFFDLKTRFAGEILQKFSNYRFKLAIIGNFSKYKSKSLQDFIRECNQRKMILFVENHEIALSNL
jgi:hypothetical protein